MMRTVRVFGILVIFFFSSRRRHTRCLSDWSSDVCSSDLENQRTSHADRRTPPSFFSRLRSALALAPDVGVRSMFSRTPERTGARGAKRLTVGLLTGCVQRVVFPQVNAATVDVLAAEGCEVVAP